ncbi:MAG: chromosome segregation protein SMC [Clostridia bacterium]|nr:chromosome segregation protein SMC [Clostridia bacterium]
MYFKSITLQGFKSFADKTVLDFNGGVTAIVGPNGSGKSNISDAIRWVMGEMSAKSLRGSKMEDVIFCGSEKRKPLGFAEVTITMDNSDKSLKLDFDEVSVTRRVYRSGESEYYINKASCRLKDIHELFMDTGLGRDGYSIIGQGKIDAILSAKSEERRHVFDEAAGISKFRYRKIEAERKLQTTNDNLLRANDIIAELESQLEPLKEQAEKAKEYLELRDVLKKGEINLWLTDMDRNKDLLDSAKKDHKIVADNISLMEQNIKSTEEKIAKLKEDSRIADSAIDSLRAEIYKKREEITKSESEAEIIKTNVEHSSNDILRITGEIDVLKKQIAALTSSLEEKASLEKAFSEKSSLAHKKVSDCRGRLDEISNEIKSLRDGVLTADADSESINEKLFRLNAESAANKQLIISESARMATLEKEISESEKLCKEKKDVAESLREKTMRLSERSGSLQKTLESAKEDAEKASLNLEGFKEELAKDRTTLATLENRRKILTDLENNFDGFAGSVKSVMKSHESGDLAKCNIFGPVSSLINCDSKYVHAIESALGGANNHIVTSTEEDAKSAISYLKKSGSGRATFLPMSAARPKPFEYKDVSKLPGYIGLASSLAEYDSKFSSVIDYLLGRVVVAENIDAAVEIAKKNSYSFKIVTLQGDTVNAGGSISGGSVTKSGSLSRRDEIENISDKIAKLEKEIDGKAKKLDEYADKAEKALAAQESASRLLWDTRREMAEHSAAVKHSDEAIAQSLKILSDLKAELASVKKSKADAESFEKSASVTSAQLNEQLALSSDKRSDAEDNISSLQQEFTKLTETLNELTAQSVSAEKDLEMCTNSIESINSEISSATAQIAEKNASIEGFSKNSGLLLKKADDLKARAENLRHEIESDEARLEILSGKKADSNNAIDDAEALLKSHNETAFRLQSEEGRLMSRVTKLESESENILTRLWEGYELTYSTALVHRDETLEYSALQKEVATLKNKMRAMGNINIGAIEDYKSTKERYDFLTTQREDILKAKEQLEQLIEEMVKVMTEMFKQNFEKLNTVFSETFRELFGGGKASLSLSTPDDILESGVEINVQPPGKNLQSITLLSGGEKAFTAIALIFSILKISPTHFCIFDEIEAALDDVNVFRFAEFLRKLSKKTQFIVITHRKGTMESADTLYGVTMQEKGITRLLSLELDKI